MDNMILFLEAETYRPSRNLYFSSDNYVNQTNGFLNLIIGCFVILQRDEL